MIDNSFITDPLCCLSHSSSSCRLGYSSFHRVRDVAGACLFNESSLEGVMKSTLTPLTTRLISSWDTRQHAFCSQARGRHRPRSPTAASLAADGSLEKLKTDLQSLSCSSSIIFHSLKQDGGHRIRRQVSDGLVYGISVGWFATWPHRQTVSLLMDGLGFLFVSHTPPDRPQPFGTNRTSTDTCFPHSYNPYLCSFIWIKQYPLKGSFAERCIRAKLLMATQKPCKWAAWEAHQSSCQMRSPIIIYGHNWPVFPQAMTLHWWIWWWLCSAQQSKLREGRVEEINEDRLCLHDAKRLLGQERSDVM